MAKKECPSFSLKDVTTSALGLAGALVWTEAIKGGYTEELVYHAIKVTIIVAIIAIILAHLHVFAKNMKEGFESHPLQVFSAVEAIW